MITFKGPDMAPLLRRFAQDDSGATAIEYGLIIALVFVAIVAAIRNYTDQTEIMYGTIEANLTN